MEPALVAAIISLGISWLCLAKVITKGGWQKWLWLLAGIFFFLSWLGNSLTYFGMMGWVIGAILTVGFGIIYAKDRKDKVRS